jgi:hypothetical protein
LRQLLPRGGRVGEIGAGLGRVAYYARCLGIADYTIVDVPIVNVIGPDRIVLCGEARPHDTSSVVIAPAQSFGDASLGSFDLVLNQDSLPELGPTVAADYVRKIRGCAQRFLSINHEAETAISASSRHQVVHRVVDEVGGHRTIHRFPYWLRTGYVEELFERT